MPVEVKLDISNLKVVKTAPKSMIVFLCGEGDFGMTSIQSSVVSIELERQLQMIG